VSLLVLTGLAAALDEAVDKNQVNPGVLGFVVVALLGVATWLLIRSMTRHLRKVDFEEDDAQSEEREAQSPGEQV
jgi:hypothetical protein